MEESVNQNQEIQNFLLNHLHQLQQQPSASKKPSKITGKIVPVHGGHIVRATGRKDRHSKVCTAKGLRDRRVRLSAHTAIQFYDVQDRLGYDRPSKAVDWLMKNAKAAIDQLDQLPPWNPNTSLDFQENLHANHETTNANANASFPSSSHVQDLRLSLLNPWNVSDNNMFSQQSVVGNSEFFTQREPLQSSNSSSLFGYPMQHSLFHNNFNYPSQSVQDVVGFGFSGFQVPVRIQGQEEEHDNSIVDKHDSGSTSQY